VNSEDTVIAWSALVQYKGFKPFNIGPFTAHETASLYEVETCFWRSVDSHYPVRPILIELLRGSVLFVPRDIKDRTVGPYSGVSQ
jgi:hypothetical protein